MTKLKVDIDDAELKDNHLPVAISEWISGEEGVQATMAMVRLMKSGDLAFWLSPRLVRRVKAYASEQGRSDKFTQDDEIEDAFASWLQQVGSIDPEVKWNVESLPDNGEIYRMLLEGGSNEEGLHRNQG